MNLPQNELATLLHLGLVVLLPIVPAYVLFKTLRSSAIVKGPFKGLNLNLGGAFAAYFALLITVLSTHNLWNPSPAWQLWEISGTITDENGKVIEPLDAKDVRVAPPSFTAFSEGRFPLTVATTPTQGGGVAFPTLMVGYPNYQTRAIPLDPFEGLPSDVQLVKDEEAHRIRLSHISLKKLPEYSDATGSSERTIAMKEGRP